MEKIMDLTEGQFELFSKSKSKVKFTKELLGLNSNVKIGIGDTMTLIDNAKALEVYKSEWNGGTNYYIVIEPMDERAAMCYSIYPKY
jgi:hypothetical protein